jgi:hypothetical protein
MNKNKMGGRRALLVWRNLIKGVARGPKKKFDCALTILALHLKALAT